jgi:hypothetical protein
MQWVWTGSQALVATGTGFSIRPTALFIIHQRFHERYCIMSILPVCRRPCITVVIAKRPLNQRG